MLKLPGWFLPALFAVFLWGTWGLLQKLATNHIAPRPVYILSALGAIAVVLVMLAAGDCPRALDTRGVILAVLAGACSSFGGLLFLHALSRGKAAVVITFTALYPLVTIILSFLVLRESVSARQGIGIVMALVSLILLAG